MRLPAALLGARVEFDDPNLVSFSGLGPVLALAERAGLSELIDEKVRIDPAVTKVKSAGVNPAGKLTTVIAGMLTGADSIDDLDAVRTGGMKKLFAAVYAAATVGQFLREFTHGHSKQLASVLRAHLVNLVQVSGLLPGIADRAVIDIDSLLRPTFGRAKQGASYGHTKIAGKQVLRKGLSPLVTTISTMLGAPVIAGMRLRAGKANSGKGAASMLAEAIRTARACGALGEVLVRGDSAYGSRAVVAACVKAGVWFSLVLAKNTAVAAAIARIPEKAWVPVNYPGAAIDPDTGELISDAEVAEIEFTAFGPKDHNDPAKRGITARLVVRRVRDVNPEHVQLNAQGELFPAWRYHPFFINSTETTTQADITHRQHAIIETVFADVIDGPMAHMPSKQFAANGAWAICAAITHNLLRAAGTLAGDHYAVARGATLRRRLVAVPARLARPQRRPVLHLPEHWPWADPWKQLWEQATAPPAAA